MAGSTAERFNKTNILVATTSHVSPYQDHDSAARLDMMLVGEASTSCEFIWGLPKGFPNWDRGRRIGPWCAYMKKRSNQQGGLCDVEPPPVKYSTRRDAKRFPPELRGVKNEGPRGRRSWNCSWPFRDSFRRVILVSIPRTPRSLAPSGFWLVGRSQSRMLA